ncbi:AI-2E family transporter [Lichenihabitans psoromatis]|uniref:AI-2E family transporter n=1 Tax=Lichenihabitans psoromatis TaxID=2528642 RepID=UPI0013F1566A|nr:AI-2E family transporter [Lichenihabitans psoromatis]
MTLFVMIVATLYFGREVLVPITLALLLAFLLAPLVALLRRLRLGHVPSVLLALIAALSVILALGAVIGSQIGQLSVGVPEYVVTIETKIAKVNAYTVGRLADLADRIGSQRSKAAAPPPANAREGVFPTPDSTAWLETGSTPLDLARRFVSPVLSPFLTLGLIFIVSVFALLQQDDLRDRLIRLLGPDDIALTKLGMEDASQRLSKYFLSQLLVNTAFGTVVAIGLLFVGVPNPVLFGILSALLRFIPYVGSLVAALLPMSLAAAVDPGWWLVLWTGVLYLAIESVTGQIIEPLLYAHNTGLSPFSVVVAAIFWSWLWGPIGLVLSTPLTMCLVVVGQHVSRLRFLDTMLGD